MKLQILNLAVKLYLTNAQQTSLLCQYVFTLARYDPNYDVRDRARFLRQFIFPASGTQTILSKQARNIFLASKPAPALESKYCDRGHFQLGSLSHYINQRATGYKDLPDFPTVAPDPTVRNIEGFMQETVVSGGMSTTKTPQKHSNNAHKNVNDKSFLSESEKSSEYSNSSTSSASDSSSEESADSSTEPEEAAAEKSKPQSEVTNHEKSTMVPSAKAVNLNNAHESGTEDSESSSSESGSGSESDSATSNSGNSDNEHENKKENLNSTETKQTPKKSSNKINAADEKEEAKQTAAAKSNLNLLLDLDDIPPIGPVMTPSLGGFLTPGRNNGIFI